MDYILKEQFRVSIYSMFGKKEKHKDFDSFPVENDIINFMLDNNRVHGAHVEITKIYTLEEVPFS